MLLEFSKKNISPFTQALAVILLFVLSVGLAKTFDDEPKTTWTLAIAYQLLFIIYNIILGMINSAQKLYWAYSIIAFMVLILTNSFLANYFSGLTMDEAGSYRWVYFVLCPVYLLFIGMTVLIRKIVSMAENDDRTFDRKE